MWECLSCQIHISVCTIQGCLIHSAVNCIKSTNYSNSGQSDIAAGNSKQARIFHASFWGGWSARMLVDCDNNVYFATSLRDDFCLKLKLTSPLKKPWDNYGETYTCHPSNRKRSSCISGHFPCFIEVPGAPNENIVQNHFNITLLNVFYGHTFIPYKFFICSDFLAESLVIRKL